MVGKYKCKCLKCEKKILQIEKLAKQIKKFKQVQDKFKIELGTKVFIEYLSEKGMIRTAMGYFVCETKKHIKIKIKDNEKYYYYIIKKKHINGMKIYYENKTDI